MGTIVKLIKTKSFVVVQYNLTVQEKDITNQVKSNLYKNIANLLYLTDKLS